MILPLIERIWGRNSVRLSMCVGVRGCAWPNHQTTQFSSVCIQIKHRIGWAIFCRGILRSLQFELLPSHKFGCYMVAAKAIILHLICCMEKLLQAFTYKSTQHFDGVLLIQNIQQYGWNKKRSTEGDPDLHRLCAARSRIAKKEKKISQRSRKKKRKLATFDGACNRDRGLFSIHIHPLNHSSA